MKFKVKQSALKKELEYLQTVVEKASTIPVLQNILIESVDSGKLRITGTDLGCTIRTEVEAEIAQEGKICVPAHKLNGIVKLLPDAEISFERDANDWTKLACNKSKFRLAGASPDSYPEVPQLKTTPLKFPARFLNQFIQNTFYSITEEQSRFTMGCAKLLVDADKVTMVTTDGHRLTVIEKQCANSGALDCLVPKKALKEVQKLIGAFDGEVRFGEDMNHVFFEIDGRTLVTRKLTGTFPNYEMALPKSNDKKCAFDAEQVKAAARRIQLMSDERSYSMKLEFKTGELHLTAQAAEKGEASEIVFVDYTGDDVRMGINSKYLLQFLNTVSSEQFPENKVSMTFKDANTQLLFQSEDEKLKHVIMPLRV